ncbi:MAG: D-alanine--D-alanine ligase [Bacteroidetes bacterium]|jgi:D-alanine-D-alanine ligase|nr:D-alanine--D-alanine ligase [Bacteroidota bacterium]
MPQPTRVGLLFGGQSAEHEVSLRSARSVARVLRANDHYALVPIGITKSGHWRQGADVAALLDEASDARIVPEASDGPGRPLPAVEMLADVDLAFPMLHGPRGEDGTVQGMLELAGIPFVGAGVAASALAMDKVLFKDVMRAHGFPITAHRTVPRRRWLVASETVLAELEEALTYPMFVKPANMGSSVGITRCETRASLRDGLMEAGQYDRKIVVERAVPHVREIEVSVLGNDEPAASVPGEVEASRAFYDYAAKYLDEGEQSSQLHIPAPLSEEQAGRIRAMALDVYRAIDCAGMARVDFLMNDETGEIFVSEVNTIPGFTAISLYPRLWEATDLPFAQLIQRLIELAFERFGDR